MKKLRLKQSVRHKGGTIRNPESSVIIWFIEPLSCWDPYILSSTAVGSRAFSVAAPRLWNELPFEIRSAKTQISFRKKLKTFFFLVRLSRLKSSVVRLAQTTNANGFWNYESDYEYVCRASELGSPRL